MMDVYGIQYRITKNGEALTTEEVRDELQALSTWKHQALAGAKFDPPLQEIGEEMGLAVGECVGPKILPWIKEAKALIKSLSDKLDAIAATERRQG